MKPAVPSLLIALGLLLLWIALTGRLDRLLTAYGYLRGDPAATQSVSNGGAAGVAAAPNIADPASLHMSGVMQALPAVVSLASLN